MVTESDLPMPYQHYLSLDRARSLKLGIDGTDATANAERLRIASRLLEEYHRIDNDAYASAHWMSEPTTAKPFGIELIVKHQGDVQAAVDDGGIRDAVRDHLGYQPHEVSVNDEDGQRWEWFNGGRADPYIQTEIDVAVVELKSEMMGGPREAVLKEIADRWTRYHEAFNEAVRTGHDLVIDSDGNLAVRAAARYDHDWSDPPASSLGHW